MTGLTFYGGVNEIGGNKILLEDKDTRIFLDFGKFFEEKEVLDKIPFSVYFELTLKKRKLDKLGIFEKEKEALLKNAKKGKIPGHKEYRKQIKNILS